MMPTGVVCQPDVGDSLGRLLQHALRMGSAIMHHERDRVEECFVAVFQDISTVRRLMRRELNINGTET